MRQIVLYLCSCFIDHSIDKSKFLALTEDEISKIIPADCGHDIISDFKNKYKMHLLRNFQSTDENFEIPMSINANANEDANGSFEIATMPLIVLEGNIFNNEDLENEVSGCAENINRLKRVEDFYTQSNYFICLKTILI